MIIAWKGTNMKSLILGLFLISSAASAARLEDVSVLEVKPGQENIELRLHAKEGPQDSYFIVDITKSDPEAFDKLVKAIKKVKQKNHCQLDLNIPSFSVAPSGSYYRSEGITFDLRTDREPNSVKTKKKNK